MDGHRQNADAGIDRRLRRSRHAIPRNIRPRNLRQGVYRGGQRPLDLYWRIRNGIEGTPMPGNDKLKPEDIWHLVNYVQSLPYEPISDAHQAEPENMRERN